MTKTAPTKKRAGPEKKIGPFAGGVGVAIWLNTVETERGSRQARSNVAKSLMWPRGYSHRDFRSD